MQIFIARLRTFSERFENIISWNTRFTNNSTDKTHFQPIIIIVSYCSRRVKTIKMAKLGKKLKNQNPL